MVTGESCVLGDLDGEQLLVGTALLLTPTPPLVSLPAVGVDVGEGREDSEALGVLFEVRLQCPSPTVRTALVTALGSTPRVLLITLTFMTLAVSQVVGTVTVTMTLSHNCHGDTQHATRRNSEVQQSRG